MGKEVNRREDSHVYLKKQGKKPSKFMLFTRPAFKLTLDLFRVTILFSRPCEELKKAVVV